jgi:crotonobetainyl-CoA:carnitine CoA-transferase CaiB-like acyl-CoA transferase
VSDALLSGFRALDLTDEKGAVCGLLLAALGVEVIKVEPPAGDPDRSSLRWQTFNRSKRGITLDIYANPGRDALERMATSADFVLESFQPGFLEELGLGYTALRAVNPGIILTSITHFGQRGPWRAYRGSDLVDTALSAVLENTGEPDRPPVNEAPDSTYFFGGVCAALGSVLAHYHRQRSGRGQHVDVSLQEATATKQGMLQLIWEFDRRLLKRSAPRVQYGRTPTRSIWRCKDGFLRWMLQGGLGGIGQNTAISQWLDDDALPNPFREAAGTVLDMVAISPDTVAEYEAAIGRLFLKHTKQELRTEGARRGIRAAVILDPREVLDTDHFEERGFWGTMHPPDSSAIDVRCPRYFFVASETENYCDRPAPGLGQDNEAILREDPHRRPPAAPAEPGPNDDQALAGVRVVDFGWELVGPYTTRPLAVHGATVIRVESTVRPDGIRTNRHIARSVSTNPDDKPWFCYVNNSKLSLQIDLKHPQARGLIERLIAWADVVNSNFRPGTMRGLGLDYESLKRLNPRIIVVESSILGQTGPLSAEAGYDAAGSAWSGRLSLQGWPDREPVTPTSAAYGDEVQPLVNAAAIVAALDYRDRTGLGQYIESSMAEVLAQQIAPALLDWEMHQHVQMRNGNRRPDAAPHGVFPCLGEDRWCAISVVTEADWRAFREGLGNPAWTAEARFATLGKRKTHEDDLEALVADWTRARTAEDVMDRLQSAGVAAGVVETAQDVMDTDPQLRARGWHVPVEHPVLGLMGHPVPPYKLLGTPARVAPAPLIGEHNFLICTDLLGLSVDEFLELEESGLFR